MLIGGAYVRIRPRSDGFAREARRQIGPQLGALGRQASDQFTRGMDSRLRAHRGRFVAAGKGAGAAAAEGVGVGFGRLNLGRVLGGVRTAAVATGKTIAAGVGVGAAALTALGVNAVRTQVEFDAAMSQVRAVSGATSSTFAELREAAIKAGAASVFTATEAAEAQAELARAGVSTADILGGALTGALDLAAAGQLGLAEAATISAQAMNLFGLKGRDVTHIADVLAAGANKSAADVQQLGHALRQGGLMAAQTGLSLEETVGALSLFADNALIGSDAGTSFKVMLQRLPGTSGPAKRAMDELGLSFYDAQGRFVGLEEAAQRMQDAFAGMSEEQRTAAMNTIFGSDAVRAANILMKAGAKGVREYTQAVNDKGAAARMAAVALDNLKGDLEAFGGEVETANIRIGDLANRGLRSLVQSGELAVGVFNNFASSPSWDRLQRNFDWLGDRAGKPIENLAIALERVLSSIEPADVDRRFASIVHGAREVREAVQGAEGMLAALGISLASLGSKAVLGPLGGIVPAINPVVAALGGMVLQSDEGRAALARLAERAVGTGRSLVTELGSAVGSVADVLGRDLGVAFERVVGAALDAAEVLGPVLGRAVRELGPPIGDLVVAGAELVANALVPAADVAARLLTPAIGAAAPVLRLAADAVELLADNTWVLVPALSALAAVKLTSTVAGWKDAIAGAAGSVRASVSDFRTYFGVLRAEGQSVGGALRGAGIAAGGLGATLATALNPAVLGVTAAISVGMGAYQAWSNNVRRVEDETEQLSRALLEQGRDVLPTLAAQFRQILDTRDSFGESFRKTGLAVSQVTEAINENAGAMDQFRSRWHAAGESVEGFRMSGEKVPASVRPIIDRLFELYDSGKLSANELRENIDAMTDLDKEAVGVSDTIRAQAQDFREVAKGITLTKDAQELLNTAMKSRNIEEQRDALNQLLVMYPDLAREAGLWTDELERGAQDSTRAVLELHDALQELQGGQLRVDEAQRRWLDAGQRVNETLMEQAARFGQAGLTLDQHTEAGRRNREALDAQVKAAFDLAAAQAQVDTTGQKSRETLESQRESIIELRRRGIIPTDKAMQDLLHTYGLTPAQIETRVRAETKQAKANVADLQRRLRNLDGVKEPVKSRIQTLIDQGKYAEAERALARLERERWVRVRVTVGGGRDGALWAAAERKALGRADGGIVDFYAHGGIRTGAERHVAHIAPAGTWRVFAEPETGGEAYIPLARSKRPRSLRVWAETGRRLGIDPDLLEAMRRKYARAFADGGVLDTTPSMRTPVAVGAGGGLTVQGNLVLQAPDARTAVSELDWWARYRMRAG